jgi:divalent metal cation (Fe/Co/Zn/Cd) transporter
MRHATGVLEHRMKEEFPQIARVTIHPEPVSARSVSHHEIFHFTSAY